MRLTPRPGTPRGMLLSDYRPWIGPPPHSDYDSRPSSRLARIHTVANEKLQLAEERQREWAGYLHCIRDSYEVAKVRWTPRQTLPAPLSPRRLDPLSNRLPDPEPGRPATTMGLSPRAPRAATKVTPRPQKMGTVTTPRAMTPRALGPLGRPVTPVTSNGLAPEPPQAQPLPAPDEVNPYFQTVMVPAPPPAPLLPTASPSKMLAAEASKLSVAEARYLEEKKEYDSHNPDDIEKELAHSKYASSAADQKSLKQAKHLLANHVATKYKHLQKAFRDFDEDKSGYLSPLEFEEAIKHLNLPITHEHCMQMAVSIADKDGDGLIDYAEFCALVKEADSSDPEWILKGRTKGVVGEFGNQHKKKAVYSQGFRAEDPDKVMVGNFLEKMEADLETQRLAKKVKKPPPKKKYSY